MASFLLMYKPQNIKRSKKKRQQEEKKNANTMLKLVVLH